ncbi:MAG: hypothetical protein FD170_3919 [Bacteroidetes bacterium]|nr:MAG: hypothetical protein FD170_3919 [Bacteroidota bacterium]
MLSAQNEPILNRVGRFAFYTLLTDLRVNLLFSCSRVRARVAFLIIAIFAISLNISAQQPISLSWPLTSPYETALPSNVATLTFSAGRSVDSLSFSADYGAMSSGWNTDNLDSEAYYEYQVTPAPGTSILINQLNFEVSLSRVNMRTSVHYSYDGFTSQKTQIGHTIYIGTPVPRNLPVKTSLRVSYPQTLSIRFYGWSTVDHTVTFHNRNVSFEGVVFGKELLAETETDNMEVSPESLVVEPLAENTLSELPQSDTAIAAEPLAAMAVMPPGDTVVGSGNLVKAPLGSQTYNTAGTFSWICPPGVTQITVECWGGGAGGHNGNNRGGGGGAYAGNSALAVTPNTTYTITVGTGGTNGGNGSNSSFSNLVIAAGAIGGNGGTVAASTGAVRWAGGNGGTSTNRGGAGGAGSAGAGGNGGNGGNTGNDNGGVAGIAGIAGAGTPGAAGGAGGSRYSNGSNGINPGGGGGERGEDGSSSGSGASGQVIIDWTIPAGNCEGFAISQTNSGVENPANALDAPDGNGALLLENGDRLTLDLTGDDNLLLTAGGSVTIRWGRFYPNSADIIVDISANNTDWYNATLYTYTGNIGFVNVNYSLTVNTRYIRFRKPNTNTREIRIDAVSFNTPCGPPCTPPTLFTVTGGGSYCSGGSGLPVGLSGSETDVIYQLYRDAVAIGAALNGTGNAISFGNQTVAGTYTVVATRDACTSNMTGSAVIIVNPLSNAPTAITGTTTICSGSSTVLTAEGGLAAYYPFTSDVNDYSGNGLNLSGSGGSFLDGGLQLSNTSSYTSISTAILNTDRYTISFDMKYTSAPDGTWRKIFGYSPAGSDRSPGIWRYPGDMRLHWRHDPGNTGLGEAFIYTINQWYRVVGEKNGSTLSIYIDGVLVEQGTVANPKASGAAPLWFGGANITLKEFKIFNSNLRWYTGSCGGTLVGSGPSITVSPTVTTTYYVRAEGICNTTTCASATVTVTSPTVAPTANAGTNAQCTQITANWAASANATGYYLDVSTVNTFATFVAGYNNLNVSNVTTYNVTGLTAGTTYYYRIRAYNSCGASSNSGTITYATLPGTPAVPGVIAGLALQCPNLSGQVYSIAAVPNATTYVWTVPAGWNITAGAGTTSITVTTGAAGQNGNITVTAGNSCGTSIASTLAVIVQSLPAQPGPIQPATTEVCQNSTHNFVVMPPPPVGVSYTWAFPGATVLSGQGTNVVSIRFGNQSGTLTVTPSNSCGNGPAQTMAISVSTSTPAMPGLIAGEPAPCVGSSKIYSVADLGFLYSWTVPAGWTITAGQGTSSITVTVGATAGNISVVAGNACGGSTPRTLAVTPQATVPAQPSEIAGISPVCAGSTQTYSVTSVPFVVYAWSIPAGWTLQSGQGTNSVTYLVGAASGTITVTPSNDCGPGTARTRNIVVDIAPPAATSAITGNVNPCQTSSQTYSVTNVSGVTYTWTLPADWTIDAGQGTNQITVTVGANNGNITVVPSNGCGNGPSTTLPVNVFLLPSSAGAISGDVLFCEGTIHNYSVVNTPGVTYQWTVPTGWGINSGQGTNTINITAGVNSGNVQVIPQNACGNGPASSLSVTVNPLPAAETGPDGAICVGASIMIGATGVAGNTYLWTADPAGEIFDFTGSHPMVKPAYTTTYTLVETNTVTGCSNTNSVTILANQVISLSVIPDEETICSGESTGFTIVSNISNTTFDWEPSIITGNSTTTYGFANGSGPVINQTIYNISNATSTVSYLIKATADECLNEDMNAVVHINPEPVSVNQAPVTICSDVASGVNLAASTNGLAIASYTIVSINSNGLTASAGNPLTGTGFSANAIADDAWTNTTTGPVNVIYTVQAVSALGCAGNTFTVTLIINPEPIVTNVSAITICNGSSPNINLTANIASSFQWTIGTITGGITGASAGSGSAINQTLTNPSNSSSGTVQYIVTPRSSAGGCFGDAFIITVTVNPGPVVTADPAERICSGSATNITLTASTTSTFTWTIGAITGSITGASAGSGSLINQVLTNPSNATSGTVDYRVIATSVDGSCVSPAFTITVTVDPIPAVTASANPTEICPGEEFDLSSWSSLTYEPVSLLSSDFNSNPTGWTVSGTNNAGAWTTQNSPYTYNSLTFISNDNSRFYFARSRNLGQTDTYLTSQVINTEGYTSLLLDFYHYFRSGGSSFGRVQLSTNGTTWTDIFTVTTTTSGGPGSFNYQSLDLSAYIDQSSLYVRFYYSGDGNRYWAIDNVTLMGANFNDIPIILWTSNPPGFTSTEEDPSDLTQSQTTTYTVTYANPHSLCSADASVTVINKPLPGAQIIADYCSTPGCVELTATGGGSYYWNIVPPTTQQTICIDEAGIYSVTVTGVNGCVETAYLSAATELVVDGSFTNFNAATPAFFTEYQQNQGYWDDPPPYDWGTAKGLHPENRYAVNTNAYYEYPGILNGYHPNFHGRDHTNNTAGARNFMMINGSTDLIGSPPHLRTIWQQTVTIHENTAYYFSAWGMNLNPDSPARLQFEIVTAQNGAEQVGSIADLNVAEKPTNEGQVGLSNWVRFYSTPSWISPPGATTAIIRIINLNTDPGGNDFGLDDISFGTLDPIPFTMSPSVVGSSNIVCEGEDIEFEANITGGLPPYTYNWSGPNGFSSNLANPVINNATAAAAGTYTLVVSDSYGCDPQTETLEVEINSAPNATITGGGNYCQFAGSPFIWFTATVGEPPFTFEYNINGGPTQTVTTWGTDLSTFVFAPTNITGTFVYTLTHVSDNNGCSRDMNVSTTVVINSLPSAYITGDWVVCPHTLNQYSGNDGMAGYAWSVSGNGSISGLSDQRLVDVAAGDDCGVSYRLLLMVTDDNGCNGTAEEVIIVEDNEAPVITTTAVSGPLSGCNPTVIAPTFTGLDNCVGVFNPVVNTAGPTNTGCAFSQTWTATYNDACGNAASPVSITYTWIQDNEAPTASDPDDIFIAGCNGSFPAPDPLVVTDEHDNCVIPAVTWLNDGTPVLLNCMETTIRTYRVSDDCGNFIDVQQNLLRRVDNEVPVISDLPDYTLTNCNEAWPVSVTTTWTDNCSAGGTITQRRRHHHRSSRCSSHQWLQPIH